MTNRNDCLGLIVNPFTLGYRVKSISLLPVYCKYQHPHPPPFLLIHTPHTLRLRKIERTKTEDSHDERNVRKMSRRTGKTTFYYISVT